MDYFRQEFPGFSPPWSGQFHSSGISNLNYQSNLTYSTAMSPPVDIVETDTQIIYIFDLPGVEADKANLEISSQEIAISASIESPAKYNGRYLHQERIKGIYARILSAPPNVDIDKVNANFKNGLLEVFFPKNPVQSQ